MLPLIALPCLVLASILIHGSSGEDVRGHVLIAIATAAAAAAVGLLALHFIARGVARPVALLQCHAARLGRGELGLKIDGELKGEFKELATCFNDMAARLTESFAALEARNLELKNEIQERQAIAAELAKAKEDADRANRAKSDFLANISHEVRTPMNGVLGMAEMLLSTDLNVNQRRYAETISRSGQAFLSILNDIMVFSKIEQGRLSLDNIPFDFQVLVEDIGQVMAARAEEGKIELVIRYPLSAPRWFVGDPAHLRQVITNLVDNAIKFTRRGHVFLDVDCLDATSSAATLRVSVEDTGIGVPEDKRQEIFEMFTQADSSSTKQFAGAGLGLAISKELVRMMGGRIGLSSDPGEGSIFYFTLPMPRDHNTSVPAYPATDLNEIRVLVVDDNPINRRVLMEYLGYWDLPCDGAASSEEAMAKLLEGAESGDSFQIVIADDSLPGTTGAELARRVKDEGPLRGTNVILLSPLSFSVEAERRVGIDYEAYVAKPVQADILYDIITDLSAKIRQGDDRGDSSRKAYLTGWSVADKPRYHARILLAEDSNLNQEVAIDALTSLGCQVDVAENGIVALEKLEAGDYDIIFMDCSMPVMDGYETTRRIRSIGSDKSRVPVVAITAHALKSCRDKCLEAGMDDYIPKPISHRSIEVALRRFCRPDAPRGKDAPPEKPAVGVKIVKDSDSLDKAKPAPVSNTLDFPKALERVGGKSEILRKVVAKYLESVPRLMVELVALLQERNPVEASKKAHRIKGDSAIVGGVKAFELALSIEKAAKDGDFAACAPLAAELKIAIEALSLALAEVDWEAAKG